MSLVQYVDFSTVHTMAFPYSNVVLVLFFESKQYLGMYLANMKV